jgi:lysophospholipase L1-like esterase
MRRRPFFYALLGAALVAAAFAIAGPAGPASAAPVRIMPLGDSITGSPGCWRALLWNRLQNTGFTNIDMVGTQPPQGCGVPYDGDGEGHGGALVTAVADQNQLVGWLAATLPDVVLMHFGTNDVWSGRTVDQVLAAYSKLVDQMRVSNPGMKILVAQIIPLAPSGCTDCPQRAVALNNAIPAWAAGKSTAQSPIRVVDQWTGFTSATDTADGVHPNDSGNQKMSDRWYPALAAALSGSTASPTATPTATPPTTTANPVGSCAAVYQILNQWPGGFQTMVTVTNNGSTTIQGWTVRFTFGNGQQISNLYNATFTQDPTGAVTAHNQAWNGQITPNGSAAFGFIGTWTGTNAVPATSCSPS